MTPHPKRKMSEIDYIVWFCVAVFMASLIWRIYGN
jgi:hypothetical protein